jgi:type I restriction enzyme M protein
LLLPGNLFYNTSAPGIIMLIDRAKAHPGEILLVNASKQFEKGHPKNRFADHHIEQIADACHSWKPVEALSAAISTEEAVRNDYNLSPSRYVALDGDEEVLPLEDAVVLLAETEEERASADSDLRSVLESLGLGTYDSGG